MTNAERYETPKCSDCGAAVRLMNGICRVCRYEELRRERAARPLVTSKPWWADRVRATAAGAMWTPETGWTDR
jgi:predicted amidophosphoribosyltransferase